jgi:hypothetical protein
VLLDERAYELEMGFQDGEGPRLILFHEAAVPHGIGAQDGGELPFHHWEYRGRRSRTSIVPPCLPRQFCNRLDGAQTEGVGRIYRLNESLSIAGWTAVSQKSARRAVFTKKGNPEKTGFPFGFFMVPKAGFEPARVSTPPPQNPNR